MHQRLFVYGTLAPGRPNEHILAPLGGAWQAATVKGHLKLEGWGAAMGFPGLIPDAAGEAPRSRVAGSRRLVFSEKERSSAGKASSSRALPAVSAGKMAAASIRRWNERFPGYRYGGD